MLLEHERLLEILWYMNNLYKTPASYFTKPAQSLRGHPMKLQVQFSRTDVRKYFFSNQAVGLWNSLPERTIQAKSLDAFKQNLSADLTELA